MTAFPCTSPTSTLSSMRPAVFSFSLWHVTQYRSKRARGGTSPGRPAAGWEAEAAGVAGGRAAWARRCVLPAATNALPTSPSTHSILVIVRQPFEAGLAPVARIRGRILRAFAAGVAEKTPGKTGRRRYSSPLLFGSVGGRRARARKGIGGKTMGPTVERLAGTVALLLATATVAASAGTDLRLVNAAEEQDKAAVRALLKQGVDVNAARADGVTALLWAAHRNDLETAQLLLRAGANANAHDDHGITPLARASENDSQAMVDALLAAGANPNLADASGLTPLMIAARAGALSVAKALVARGASVNASTGTNNTALMWAVSERHRDVAVLLLEVGADVR